jgi:putative restriction endonuclease
MIAEPVFFDPPEWVSQPKDWSREIVQGKTYELASGEGRRIWEDCLSRVRSRRLRWADSSGEASGGYGSPVLVRPRLGQGIFRIAVTEAYERACALTDEHSLPALEAAHIRPFSAGGPHDVRNGLLLRSDIHRLFDRGYVTVTPEHRFEVSRRLREDFENGRTYYPLHGRRIRLPPHEAERPSLEFLRWHNENVYRG